MTSFSRTRQVVLLSRLMWDFVKGLYILHQAPPCVTVFGSARLNAHTPEYVVAQQVGRSLSRLGLTVMTGGGPGLMAAVTRGAQEAGGRCAACGVRFEFEQDPGAPVDWRVTFRYMFVRKVMLCRYSCAFVVLPGGLGTLDELFEILTLMQTKKVLPAPIVLIGTAYWRPLFHLLVTMVEAGTVGASDMSRICLTDDVEEMVAHIKTNATAASHRSRRPLSWTVSSASSSRDL